MEPSTKVKIVISYQGLFARSGAQISRQGQFVHNILMVVHGHPANCHHVRVCLLIPYDLI